MTVWYSDHFGADGIADSTPALPSKLRDAGITHSRMRVKRMQISLAGASPTPAVNDVLRLGQFKPTDRIYQVFANVETVMGTAGTCTLGFHESGARNNGAVADADVLSASVNLNSVARADTLPSATIENADRGRPLYEWLDEARGDTVYSTSKRDVSLDLTATLAGTLAAAGVFIFEVWYVSGD
jgi:hypothetical protein